MKKFVSSVAILALIVMETNYNCYAKDYENKERAKEEQAQLNQEIDLNKIAKKSKKAKKARKITTFDTANDSEEKTIEVNSVNFIQLKSKAGKVFVPDSKIADVDVIDDQSLLLMGLKPGMTSLIVNDKEGNVIANYKIRVTYPLAEIKNTVAQLHPDSSIDLISMDDSVILKGKVASPEDASDIQTIVSKFVEQGKIINKMEIATATQVMLKVKIAEVSRSVSQNFGINWRAISFGNTVGGTHAGALIGTLGDPFKYESALDTFKQNLTQGEKGLSSGSWFIQTGGNNNLSAVINALDEESFASIIAEPTLIAISGGKATFSSGGEYGYHAESASGSGVAKTTEFKEYGTNLEFTPVVVSENRIKITVKPKITAIDKVAKDGTPSTSKKEAETTVELGSGQSLAIAGLLQTNKSSTNTRTPGLANLPLIGSLFRSSKVIKEQRECVIIVTPYIVKPSSKGLKAPTDSMTKMYSAVDVVLKGRSHARAPKVALSIK